MFTNVKEHGDFYSGREDASHVNPEKEQANIQCRPQENIAKFCDWTQVTSYYIEEPSHP